MKGLIVREIWFFFLFFLAGARKHNARNTFERRTIRWQLLTTAFIHVHFDDFFVKHVLHLWVGIQSYQHMKAKCSCHCGKSKITSHKKIAEKLTNTHTATLLSVDRKANSIPCRRNWFLVTLQILDLRFGNSRLHRWNLSPANTTLITCVLCLPWEIDKKSSCSFSIHHRKMTTNKAQLQ